MAEYSKRDQEILYHMLRYSNETEDTINRFGESFDTFVNDIDFYKSVSMSVFQLSELSNSLSDEFKEENKNIPWREIRGMRNVIAHRYNQTDDKELWNTATSDVPGMKEFCTAELQKIEIERQNSQNTPEIDNDEIDDDDLEL
jgi:uncharacterized protein with HEPN domain